MESNQNVFPGNEPVKILHIENMRVEFPRLIDNRFEVLNLIDHGSQGAVFDCID
jgi:hypothetical protein